MRKSWRSLDFGTGGLTFGTSDRAQTVSSSSKTTRALMMPSAAGRPATQSQVNPLMDSNIGMNRRTPPHVLSLRTQAHLLREYHGDP